MDYCPRFHAKLPEVIFHLVQIYPIYFIYSHLSFAYILLPQKPILYCESMQVGVWVFFFKFDFLRKDLQSMSTSLFLLFGGDSFSAILTKCALNDYKGYLMNVICSSLRISPYNYWIFTDMLVLKDLVFVKTSSFSGTRRTGWEHDTVTLLDSNAIIISTTNAVFIWTAIRLSILLY